MMVELDKIGVNYDERTVRKKRRIDKALGRFQLFCYLKVTEKEVDCKCVSIVNYLEVNQGEVVWWSQSYVAWQENEERTRLMEDQVPKVNKTKIWMTSKKSITQRKQAWTSQGQNNLAHNGRWQPLYDQKKPGS